MACCGKSEPTPPIVRKGLPTIWAYLPPTHGLVPVPAEEVDPILASIDAGDS